VLVVFALSQALNAQTITAVHTGTTPAPVSQAAGASVDLTLTQASDIGTGVVSQIFEAAFSQFDSEMADDFVIPAGGARTIVSFQPAMFSTIGLPIWEGPLTMTVYDDAGGAPGTAIFQEVFPPDIPGAELFSTNCPPLNPGTYWIGVQVDQDFVPFMSIAAYLLSTENTAGPGLVSYRTPGDGFGSGCTDWAPVIDCVAGLPATSMGAAMTINLSEPLPEPEVAPIPTMGEWGLMVLGIMLLIFGLVAVNQKRSTIQTLA